MLIHIADTGHGLPALPFARTALVTAAPLHADQIQSQGKRNRSPPWPAA